MSSCIFSSDANRRYVLGLVTLALLPAFGLFALGVFLGPLYGDLTRIGSYSEREFGWTKPQLKFTNPLYTKKLYNRYHDVVVLGDSFSWGSPQHQWQNYVVAATDWSVVTLEFNSVNLDRILENPVFRETPPKILVFETVERYLTHRIKDAQACDASEIPQHSSIVASPPLVRIDNLEKLARYVEPERDWSNVKLEFVVKYLENGALRSLKGVEQTDARKVSLMAPAPFSSANKQEMLVYKDDFQKVPKWHEMGVREMGCRIERIRKKVEANGRTRFVLMVAPDKLTAYSDFLSDKSLRNLSMLTGLSEQHSDVMPRIDLALTSAIRAGEWDVYLPNDTHWGSNGHRITAEALLGFLQARE